MDRSRGVLRSGQVRAPSLFAHRCIMGEARGRWCYGRRDIYHVSRLEYTVLNSVPGKRADRSLVIRECWNNESSDDLGNIYSQSLQFHVVDGNKQEDGLWTTERDMATALHIGGQCFNTQLPRKEDTTMRTRQFDNNVRRNDGYIILTSLKCEDSRLLLTSGILLSLRISHVTPATPASPPQPVRPTSRSTPRLQKRPAHRLS
jgi:hypothetical protein